jgi:hypothetical protein
MRRVHVGGMGRSASPVLVVHGVVGGVVHPHPVHTVSYSARVRMWEMIYLAKIKKLLAALDVEATTESINLVAELMKDAILDSVGKDRP